MSSALTITRSVNPPRAAFLDFPLGHTTGKPLDRALQRAILRAALAAFDEMRSPGQVLALPFAWSEDDSWKDAVMRAEAGEAAGFTAQRDDRAPRVAIPQYQSEQDRELAEQALARGGCPGCVWLEPPPTGAR